MSRSTELAGKSFLIQYLRDRGRTVIERSDRRTFDLIVDGVYAEMKAKGKGLDKFDFFALTKNQQAALDAEEPFIVFLVLGVLVPGKTVVIEIPSSVLLKVKPKIWTQYFWDKGLLNLVCSNLPSVDSP